MSELQWENGEEVDLTNCDREPIHIPGRIQSFGCLLVVSSDWVVAGASANLSVYAGHDADAVLGLALGEVLRLKAIHDIRTQLQLISGPDSIERLYHVQAFLGSESYFDLAVHPSGRRIIIEFERSERDHSSDITMRVRPMIDRVRQAPHLRSAADMAARQMRSFTGFDRVMVYQFHHDQSGEVIGESRKLGMPSFQGLRYPASDIPKQARALYLRNMLRIIADVDSKTVPLVPEKDASGVPLDLSMSTLRAVSPIHIEYLRNMGVGASMSVSIVVHGKLWGLIACHHESAHTLSFERRSAAELFGQLFAFVITEFENEKIRERNAQTRSLHDHLMARLAMGGELIEQFQMVEESVVDVIPHDGAAMCVDGVILTLGETPAEYDLQRLVRFLNTGASSQIFSSSCLSQDFPPAAAYAEQASGLLALPVSRKPRDYLLFFRREQRHTVTWAGDPNKPVKVGSFGTRLQPRESFAAWTKEVKHTSAPFTEHELHAAETIRVTLLEVVLRLSELANEERQKSQAKQELLIAELNHRVRNILNLIRGLISQSQGSTDNIEEFTKIVGGRVHALARAHEQVTQQNWSPASLKLLLQTELDAYIGQKADRISYDGPDVLVNPTALTTLALVMHELITNSVKYGALSDSRGRIKIQTKQTPQDDLQIVWREHGGPPVQAPTRRGFGSTIIERAIPYDLGGSADVRFALSGVEVDMQLPRQHIHEFLSVAHIPKQISTEGEEHTTIALQKCLVLEDNMIIAIDAEDMMLSLGVQSVFTSANVTAAEAWLANNRPDFALLDINLGSETSEEIAQLLFQEQIPFCFATGYGDSTTFTALFPGVPVLAKPFAQEQLADALREALMAKDTE